MYLKSLEMQGFKSFCDKTVVNFSGKMTAVVGPNGSGKSNIADAIRWVLGEQSTKTLRGAKMEDVIFGGTATRKSVGYAQVSLTVDNSDHALAIEYNEVMVTRRYYRSGESEYYINNNHVRLKDIHELFMDTGLGRDGYSIIGQGRIDEILSLKSEDRRSIFEEAAGISKYRYKKSETERKLNMTEDNLVRIRDIITELEGRVEPLRVQAEDARRFLALREQLKGLEVSVWLENTEKLKAEQDKAALDHSGAGGQIERAKYTIEQLEAKNQEYFDQLAQMESQIEEKRKEFLDMELKNSALTAQVMVLQANIGNNRENIDRVQAEIGQTDEQNQSLDLQIEQKNQDIANIGQQMQDLDGQIMQLLDKTEQILASSSDNTKKTDAMRTGISEITAEIALLHTQSFGAQTQIGTLSARRGDIVNGLDGSQEDYQRIQDEHAAAREFYEEQEQIAASAKNIIDGFELRFKNREQEISQLSDQVMRLKTRLNTAISKRTMLVDLEKEFEGFSKAVKVVMNEKALQGVHGPVSRLISTADEYSVAIETALGAALSNIVVDNENVAKNAISILKSRDAGRCTFLPLNAIKGQYLSEKAALSEPNVYGVGSQLVEFDAKYSEIINNLLGRTVVVKNIDTAIALAKKYGYKFRIITLDGQIINAGGAITGGAINRNIGLLSRANQIKHLAEEIEQTQNELDTQDKIYQDKKREYDAALYQISVAKEEKQRADEGKVKAETQVEHLQQAIDSMEKSREDLEREKADIDGKIAQLEQEVAQAAQETDKQNQRLKQMENELDQMIEGMSGLEQEKGELSTQIQQLRLDKTEKNAQKDEAERQLISLGQLKEQMRLAAQDKGKVIEEYLQKNCGFQKELEQIEEQIAQNQTDNSQRDGQIKVQLEQRLELEKRRNECDKEIRDKNEGLMNLERELMRLENRLEQAKTEVENISKQLWESYEMTLFDAQQVKIPIEKPAEAGREISRLKNQIRAIGNVNPGAIEEYAEVSQRYEFLSGQRQDLEQAKADLEKIIEELVKQMRSIFTSQFEIINTTFGQVFKQIFGGGSAVLELEDTTDVLTSGIEIKVQPPGKAVRTISLLSGGEKAFVAISLYFAILKVRPTPFCVLDEIEAALDDVNVTRFARYLKTITHDTQFIVITHKRGTMEECDVLYGVTMPEQGVSKMLALNIAQVEEMLDIK